jgi:hypothetical protein
METVMRRWTTIVAACGMAASVLGAGATVAAAQGEEHGLSQRAVEIARPFGFPVTNSMLVMWIVAVGLIVFAQLATRSMTEVPGGAQNFLEWLIEGLYGFLEGIIGPHWSTTFWFFATSSSSSSPRTGWASSRASAPSAGDQTPRLSAPGRYRGANAASTALAMALISSRAGSFGHRENGLMGIRRAVRRRRAGALKT